MTDTAEFPLPHDVTDEERETAKRELAKYTKIRATEPTAVRFDGRLLGKTGPIWHFQYTRMYALPKGYLVAAHDLREGIFVGYADSPEKLGECFEHGGVREFVEDELRFRGIIGAQDAAEQPRA